MPIIECVPNISEGRKRDVIDAVVSQTNGIAGVTLVSCESDADHNRSVITFAGTPDGVVEAAFRIYAKAAALVDLNHHTGEHPRMGAVDVCPFIPIRDASMEDCAQLARKLGARVGRELNIPVYLYEAAASRPERKNLADIRKGQFEKLRELIGKDPSRVPDFGPNAIHPTAGCTAIGARFFLVAYNVNLDTPDVTVAKEIATAIREKDGGMPAVKAMGFMLEKEQLSQVSMNLVDYRKSSPAHVYARIEELAAKRGVAIRESEIVGVIPQDTMTLCAKQRGVPATDNLDNLNFAVARSLKIKEFRRELILENHLEKPMSQQPEYMQGIEDFLNDLASANPTPGGGAAAAVLTGIGCALAAMVGNLTVGKKKYVEVESRARAVVEKAADLRTKSLKLYHEDIAAFDKVSAAFKMPKDTDEQKESRAASLQEALQIATLSPLKCAEAAMKGLELAHEIAEIGNTNAISDAGVAALSLNAAVHAATLNMRINLANITDKGFVTMYDARAKELERRAADLAAKTRQLVLGKI